ncbi:hypothetical protein [Lysobacter sp. Root494]|uniref:hypothetical protein n=1 Tax=Lysobacter sp. Root494 TaxID=1736549 RepID=UPI0012F73237|nr:hypothetical protein [Lysobacter sp. Root494]
MNLQDFITETLAQIVQGVKAAQELALQEGAEVNPRLTGGPSINSAHGFIASAGGNTAQVVSFDVALTVKEGSGTKGGIGVFAGAVSLGTSGQSSAENSSISHVKFSVPLALPTRSEG